MKVKSIIFIIVLVMSVIYEFYGQVGIGISLPDSSAILDLSSTNRGLLLPRMTTSQIFHIHNPSVGLMTFNTDSLDFWYFNGYMWIGIVDHSDTLDPNEWHCGIDVLFKGQLYPTKQIGTQCWFTKNLSSAKYRNDDPLTLITDGPEWGVYTIGAYCWYNNDSATYDTVYGKLYNWYAANDIRGICPTGWHVPTDGDWTILSNYLGGLSLAGGKLKEAGMAHWQSPNTGATNESGFTALPGGYRDTYGYFDYVGIIGFFWSSSEEDSEEAWTRRLYYNYNNLYRYSGFKELGISIRCVEDD
jgi:uncharacterized protein (TIGR02145 family)